MGWLVSRVVVGRWLLFGGWWLVRTIVVSTRVVTRSPPSPVRQGQELLDTQTRDNVT